MPPHTISCNCHSFADIIVTTVIFPINSLHHNFCQDRPQGYVSSVNCLSGISEIQISIRRSSSARLTIPGGGQSSQLHKIMCYRLNLVFIISVTSEDTSGLVLISIIETLTIFLPMVMMIFVTNSGRPRTSIRDELRRVVVENYATLVEKCEKGEIQIS